MINKTISLLAILFISFSANSFAGNVSASTKATATLSTSCSFTMGDVSFGEVIPGQASATTTNTLNVLCSKGLAYTFGTTHPTDGSDCPYMVGAVKANKLYYFVTYQGTFLANGLANGKISGTGTGAVQAYNLQSIILPAGIPSNFGCAAKNPGANYGFNPYVAPDSYSTTANMVVTF